MPNIGPVTDQYIDSIIKSAGVANPNLSKTQGTGMRELIKLLRDRLEQQCGGTSCTPLIPHTYTELSTMVTGSSLVPGQKYLITDYKTVYNQPVTNIIMQGDVEPLVIAAVSTNEFDSKVTSTVYPDDLIEYQFAGPNNGVTVEYSIDTATSMSGTYNYPYSNLDDSFLLILWNDSTSLEIQLSNSPTSQSSNILSASNGNLTLYVLAKMITNTLNIAINGVVHTFAPGHDSITDWYTNSRNTGVRTHMPTGDSAIIIGTHNVVIQAFDNDNPQPSYTPIPAIVQSGWITKRTDPQHNEAPFDLRAVKFRRYKALLTDVPSMINGPSLSTGDLVLGAYAPSTSNYLDRGVFVAGKIITGLVHNNNDGSYIQVLSYDLISEENVLADNIRIGNSDLLIDETKFADYLCFTADGDATNSEGRITSCQVSNSSEGLPNVVIRAFPEMKVTGTNIGNNCTDATVYAYELAVSDINIGYDTDAMLVVDSQMVKIGYQSRGVIVSNANVVTLLGAFNDAAAYGSNITMQPRSENNVLSGINVRVDTQSNFNYIFNSTGVTIGAQSFNNRIYGSVNINLTVFDYQNDIFDTNDGLMGGNSHSNVIRGTNGFKFGYACTGNNITQNNDITMGYSCDNNTLGQGCANNTFDFSSGNTLGTNCLRNYLRGVINQSVGDNYSNNVPWTPAPVSA